MKIREGQRPGPSLLVALLQHTTLFVLLVVSALIAMRVIALPPTNVTVIWFPSGIALVALLTRPGWAALPTIFIAQWAIIALANDYDFLSLRPYSLLICAANTFGPALGAWIWKRGLVTSPFTDGAQFLRFAFGIALLPSILTAWMVIAVIVVAGYLPGLTMEEFLLRSGIITISGALGVFLVVPLIMAPWQGSGMVAADRRWAAHIGNAVLALVVSWLAFRYSSLALYLTIPLALISAITCGARGVAVSILIISIYGLIATAQGLGPFVAISGGHYSPIFEMGVFAFCLGIPGQFAGITLDQLRRHHSQLEDLVAARTKDLTIAKDRAESADRAKSEFLATMSHEIRTPMNGVIGFAQLLKSSSMDDEQKEYVQAILTSGEMLLALLNDILDLSKIEAGAMVIEKAPMNIRDIVNDITRLFASTAANKKVALSQDIEATVPDTLVADATHVQQIIANLVSNALKFTEQGQVSIHISALPHKDGPQRFTLMLKVSDTGIGISAEQIACLFQPFRQADASTSRRFGGSGLGLVISRRLCELMDGSLEASSKPEQGSTFVARITVEADTDTPQADPPCNDHIDEKPEHPLVVLVVEDNMLNQQLIGLLLERKGHSVGYANNGQEALNALEKRDYDLVLMDIQMPIMDGLEATRHIRDREAQTHGPRLPIIAVTANVLLEHRAKCFEIGMDGHLPKPLNAQRLHETISTVMREQRAASE